jgi:glutaredoxin-like protein
MLHYINPSAKKRPLVSLFSKVGCPYCLRAKKMLEEKGLQYEEIILGRDATSRSLRAMSGNTTTPQVFIDGQLIGGSEELTAYLGA